MTSLGPWFVTGGSGFVGRNLISVLRQQGESVRALARSDRSAGTVTDLGAEAVRGELDNVEAMVDGMVGCKTAVHSAARVGDWGPRREFIAANVKGTSNVLDAARRAGVSTLVHVSTEAVLVGDGRRILNADETWPLPERPTGLYPETKGMAENLVIGANSDTLRTVVVRPRLIWGAGDTSVLPRIEQEVRNGNFRWIGGGTYLTSTCHVRNVVHGILLAAEKGGGGQVYFLTDGEPQQFKSFIGAQLRARGLEPPDKSIPRWLIGAVANVAEALWTVFPLSGAPIITRTGVRLACEEVTVNDAKARRDLGYAPVVTIEEGLAEIQPDTK